MALRRIFYQSRDLSYWFRGWGSGWEGRCELRQDFAPTPAGTWECGKIEQNSAARYCILFAYRKGKMGCICGPRVLSVQPWRLQRHWDDTVWSHIWLSRIKVVERRGIQSRSRRTVQPRHASPRTTWKDFVTRNEGKESIDQSKGQEHRGCEVRCRGSGTSVFSRTRQQGRKNVSSAWAVSRG